MVEHAGGRRAATGAVDGHAHDRAGSLGLPIPWRVLQDPSHGREEDNVVLTTMSSAMFACTLQSAFVVRSAHRYETPPDDGRCRRTGWSRGQDRVPGRQLGAGGERGA